MKMMKKEIEGVYYPNRGFANAILSTVVSCTGSFLEGMGSALSSGTICTTVRSSDSEAILKDFSDVGNDIKQSIVVFQSSIKIDE